jgi:hypothetical protein
MKHLKPLLAAVALLALGQRTAAAQFPDRVQPGARVRVWIPEPYLQANGPWKRQQLRATVSGIDGDVLRLTVPGAEGTLSIPRSAIRRLDVSKGPPSRAASALERAVGFAIAGAISAALENNPGSDEWPAYNRTWRAAEEGAKIGAVVGAVVGFVLPSERWRRVKLSR